MKRIPWLAITLVLFGAVVLMLMPEEKTLGGSVRLVFLHGALIWVSLLLYFLSALFGATYWVRGQEKAFVAANSLWRWAVIANAISFPTGLYAAKVIWGAVLWSEPRVMANGLMLLSSLLVLGVSLISGNRRGISGLFAIASVAYGVMLLRTSRILHPVNPVGNSDSVSIKVSFGLVMLTALALAIEAVRRDLKDQDNA